MLANWAGIEFCLSVEKQERSFMRKFHADVWIISAATCPEDAPVSPVNRADFMPGPYDYEERVYLNCSRGPQLFRHCTYNPATDDYELQGSPYQCPGMLVVLTLCSLHHFTKQCRL